MAKVKYYFGSAVDTKVQEVLHRIKNHKYLYDFSGMLLVDYYGTSIGPLRRLRKCLKLLVNLSNFYGFLMPEKGLNYRFINTSRLDSVEKFDLYFQQEGLSEFSEIKKKYSNGWKKYEHAVLLSFYALNYLVRYGVPLEVGLKVALLPIHKNKLLKEVEFIPSVGRLILFTDHDEYSLLLALMFREKVKIISLVHGMPLYFQDFEAIPPSSLMYKYSFINEYIAPTELGKNQLTLLLDKISPGKITSIHTSDHSFYAAGLQLGVNLKGKVVACLSNDRWHDANLKIISVAKMVSWTLSLQMEIRAHPGLSKCKIEKMAKGVGLQVDMNLINPMDIYIMTHSTLYFDLLDIGCNHVYRVNSKNFDDFGVRDGVVKNYIDIVGKLVL